MMVVAVAFVLLLVCCFQGLSGMVGSLGIGIFYTHTHKISEEKSSEGKLSQLFACVITKLAHPTTFHFPHDIKARAKWGRCTPKIHPF